jgi:HD-GYP domain-containing protein (c-di-GMP phosphodiesterase class II)
MLPDMDGVIRRIPLIYKYHNSYIFSLTFRVVCDYLKINYNEIEIFFGRYILLKNAEFPNGLKKDIKIPIDQEGNMMINFVGTWNDSFFHYDFSQLIRAKKKSAVIDKFKDEIKGALVLISNVNTMSNDHGSVPLENIYPLSGIQANAASTIMLGNFMKPVNNAELLLISLCFIIVLWTLTRFSRNAFFYSVAALSFYFIFLALSLFFFIFLNKMTGIINPSLGFFLSLFLIILLYYSIGEKTAEGLRKKAEAQLEKFLLVLSSAIESKDRYTGGHVERVAKYARDLAYKHGFRGNKLRALYLGAMVHDVGKIGVRDTVLNKAGSLSPQELAHMQSHPTQGKILLSKIEDIEIATIIAHCHQERFDGKGYPQGLKGEDIPIEARIVTIVDYWDAIITDRPYRKAFNLKKAIDIMRQEKGKAFDPLLYDLFMDEKDKLYLKYVSEEKVKEL